MKLSNYLFISIATILLSSINLINSAQNNYFITPLIKTAKAYSSFANLPYCNLEVINSLSCPLCSSILDASFKVVSTHTNKINENNSILIRIYIKNIHNIIYRNTDSSMLLGPAEINKQCEQLWRSAI